MPIVCPSCGREYQRVSRHWRDGDCDYPEIPPSRGALLDGLVLAGAHVHPERTPPYLRIGTTSERLAKATA
ncbi:hypothetical protein BRD18_04220, partial [Halobacteriales archaeon SW_7_71_33]